MNKDRPRLTLNNLSLASKLIELFAANFKGGIHGRSLHIFAYEGAYGAHYLCLARDAFALGQNRSRYVFRIGGDAQKQSRRIVLIRGEHKFACLDSPTHKNGQNSRRHRVESACVTRLVRAEKTLHASDNRLGRKPLFLIYNNYSVFQIKNLLKYFTLHCSTKR